MFLASTSVHIDIAFIPVYAILLVLLAINLYNHRHNGFASFGFATAFSVSRLVGNILLVAANYSEGSAGTIQNLYIAGIVIQSVGFALLINSALSLLEGVVGKEKKGPNRGGLVSFLTRPLHLAHLLALVATILLIIGMTSINYSYESLLGSKPVQLNAEAKAGNLIYIAIVALVGITVFYFLILSGNRYSGAQRFTLGCLLFNIVPMLVRCIWLAFRVFGLDNYFRVNVWVQFGLQYIPELIVTLTYTALGLVLTYKFKDSKFSKARSELEENKLSDQGHSDTEC